MKTLPLNEIGPGYVEVGFGDLDEPFDDVTFRVSNEDDPEVAFGRVRQFLFYVLAQLDDETFEKLAAAREEAT